MQKAGRISSGLFCWALGCYKGGMRNLKTLILTLCALLCLANGAAAQEPAAFFETLYDVPVMPGLEELPQGALAFDKPSGRIAQAQAAGRGVSRHEIQAFYREALPQLGWLERPDGSYRREGEVLQLEIREEQGYEIVHFTLSPLR